MAISPETLQRTRQVFLWLMSCMYMWAFASLYTQIPGLYGPNGLTPVHNVVPRHSGNSSWLERLQSLPSILTFYQDLQLPPHYLMELCCVVGALLGLLMMIFRAMRCSFMFLILWVLYLSVYKVGQVFLWFQWDSLLLEAGFLTIIVAPLNLVFWKKPAVRHHDGITLWLVRWLLFRLMFASGVVKLTSQCPTWWGLTALNYHYESQCIPTPLSWYAHQLPEWFQKMSIVGTYFIEIAVPLLFFVPVRSLRIFAFWCQVFLQLLIILTGNYNFFNAITISLCFSLVDDQFLGLTLQESVQKSSLSQRITSYLFGRLGSTVHVAGRLLMFAAILGYMLALTVYYFEIHVESWSVVSTIWFTSTSFESALSVVVPVLAVFAAISLVIEVLSAFLRSLSASGFNKLWSVLQTGIFTTIAVLLFTISLVSYGGIDRTFYSTIPSEVMRVHSTVNDYSLTSPYGLFRRMTGVGGRPELIIEGTNDLQAGPWKEYSFLYKPGDLNKAATYVAPHQPRLDWQMWFAALGSYQHNPWLVHLVYRLLIGQKEVLQLIAPPPFKKPPRYIRAQLYHYHYTSYDKNKSLLNQSESTWYREFKSEYLFPLTWDNPGLEEYLEKYSYLSTLDHEQDIPKIFQILIHLREYTEELSPPTLLWTLFLTAGICTGVQFFRKKELPRFSLYKTDKEKANVFLRYSYLPRDRDCINGGCIKPKDPVKTFY